MQNTVKAFHNEKTLEALKMAEKLKKEKPHLNFAVFVACLKGRLEKEGYYFNSCTHLAGKLKKNQFQY
jgi:tellurite resistance protein